MNWEYGAAVESSAVPLPVPAPYVDGAFVDGASVGGGATVAALNPATEGPLVQVGTAGRPEVERAVTAARRAQVPWAALPGADRAHVLFRFARVVAGRASDLAVLETLGTGRPIRLTRDVDLPAAVAHQQSCAGWADNLGYAGHGPAPRPVGVVGASVTGGSPQLGAVRRIGP
ncbi:MAG: aldehyde dehydrogenase, partial [Pseudonocardiales bacterium]|nr:aldehyde dehydrogenase [Pseudonocardiales bacterium]